MKNAIVLDESPIHAAVTAAASPARSIASLVPALQLASQDDLTFATGILQTIKKEWKAHDDQRKLFTGPALNFQRAVNALYSPVLTAYAQAETVLKSKIAQYQAQQEQVRTDAMVRMQPAPPPAELAGTGVAVRTKRRWRVTDPDKVPRQWCSPDPAKIQAHLDGGGLEAIAGIEFYDEQIVSVRT